MPCHGAVGLADGQFQPLCYGKGILFRQEYERAYYGYLLPVQICHGAEGIEAALVEQAHKKGFYYVVPVVAEGNEIAAVGVGVVIKRAAAELGAQGAGVGLLAYVKYDVAYVRFEYLKGHAYGLSKVRDGLIILIRYAEIQHNAYQIKGGMAELLIQLQAVKQQQAVLAAGYADAYLIAGVYHAVSFIGTSYAAENTFHNKNTFQITIYKAL